MQRYSSCWLECSLTSSKETHLESSDCSSTSHSRALICWNCGLVGSCRCHLEPGSLCLRETAEVLGLILYAVCNYPIQILPPAPPPPWYLFWWRVGKGMLFCVEWKKKPLEGVLIMKLEMHTSLECIGFSPLWYILAQMSPLLSGQGKGGRGSFGPECPHSTEESRTSMASSKLRWGPDRKETCKSFTNS